MEVAVISERLSELLDDCEVRAAVFTTYTFDPEFFEQELIPLLLPGNIAFSSDSRVKQFQVREALRESGIALDVFFDLSIFRREGSTSPSMEYRFQGVHRGNNAFHAKLALILCFDNKHKQLCLMVGAGSNNLTRAGWWENIECMHWEMVWPGDAPRKFLDQLITDVDWLKEQRRLENRRGQPALDQIWDYLQDCPSRTSAQEVSYYGLDDVNRRGAFHGFLGRSTGRKFYYSNWTLEIISPFFAEDTANLEHKFFLNMEGVKEIHLLLPMDQEGNALCKREYFDHIDKEDRIKWATWGSQADRDLGLKGQFYRRLHAKVYHFYNQKQSWAFVGSVNFSHKAMRENIEAGFLVKLEEAGPLLKPIARPGRLEHFLPPTELVPGFLGEELDEAIPRIFLSYDWREKVLTGVTEWHQSYTISIMTPEGSEAVKDWAITGTSRQFEGEVLELERLLRNGSLVKVVGTHTRSGDPFPGHNVMLQQTGWTHKPMDLPDLSAAEILSIYAGLSPEQRQAQLVSKIIHQLVLSGAGGDMTISEDDLIVDQFFSEYAEIFHAFRHLNKRLMEALDAGNQVTVDYYLTGTAKDSLPTLIGQTVQDNTPVNPVTAYLIHLCVQEIYQQRVFAGDAQVKRHLGAVKRQIRAFKKPGVIRLEDDAGTKRKTFFKWFEKQFFMNYRGSEA